MSVINVTLFSQVLKFIDRDILKDVRRAHESDKHSKGINTWTHLVSMLFMHLAKANSNRDISNGLRIATGNLSHLGVTRAPGKSSMSYINAHRNHEVFKDLYFAMLEKLEPSIHRRRKYAKRLKRQIFIMDASVIPLSLGLFDWAKFRTKKGAIKLHAVLDYDTALPSYAMITEGKMHDSVIAKQTQFPTSSVLVMNRAYVDYGWLKDLDRNGVFFVSRLKSNASIEVLESFLTKDKDEHVLSDEEIALTGFYTSQKYPGSLRIVRVYDEINDKILILLTNNKSWTADTISQLYKARWDVEVFFKHLKQLFKVKTFIGTSPNAVRIQMWTSLIAILLLNYLKRMAEYKWNLSNLVSFLRINLFVKIDLWKWVNNPLIKPTKPPPQPSLF